LSKHGSFQYLKQKLPASSTIITILQQARQSNMKENARQQLFPRIFFPYFKTDAFPVKSIFLLTKKWG